MGTKSYYCSGTYVVCSGYLIKARMMGDVNWYHLGRRVVDSGRNMLCMFPEKQGTNVTGVDWSGMG